MPETRSITASELREQAYKTLVYNGSESVISVKASDLMTLLDDPDIGIREWTVVNLANGQMVGVGPTEDRSQQLEHLRAWQKDGYMVALMYRTVGPWRQEEETQDDRSEV